MKSEGADACAAKLMRQRCQDDATMKDRDNEARRQRSSVVGEREAVAQKQRDCCQSRKQTDPAKRLQSRTQAEEACRACRRQQSPTQKLKSWRPTIVIERFVSDPSERAIYLKVARPRAARAKDRKSVV